MLLLVNALVSLIGLAGFAAGIWILVLAFRKSVGWGLAVLFLFPIGMIVFAVKNWDECKIPFAVHAGAFAACFAWAIFVFSSLGGFAMMNMAHQMSSGELDEQQAETMFFNTIGQMEGSPLLDDEQKQELAGMKEMFEQMRQQAAGQGTANSTGSSAPATPPAPGAARGPAPSGPKESASAAPASPAPKTGETVKRGFQKVPLREARRHIGRRVVIVGRDGREYRGTLGQVDKTRLLIERDLGGGSFSFEMRYGEIRSLQVSYL